MLLINLIINFFSIGTSVGLERVSKVNQKCMSRPKIIDVNKNDPVFYPYLLKLINAVDLVILLMINLLNYVFLTSLKILMLKYLI